MPSSSIPLAQLYLSIALPFGTCLCGFKWATCDTYLCRVYNTKCCFGHGQERRQLLSSLPLFLHPLRTEPPSPATLGLNWNENGPGRRSGGIIIIFSVFIFRSHPWQPVHPCVLVLISSRDYFIIKLSNKTVSFYTLRPSNLAFLLDIQRICCYSHHTICGWRSIRLRCPQNKSRGDGAGGGRRQAAEN